MKTAEMMTVNEAVASTFENLAFMEAQPTEAEAFQTDNALCASVQCIEPRTGGLALYLPRFLAEEFATNSLGEPTSTDEAIQDVLGETCNVIAGRIGAKQDGTLLLTPPAFEFKSPTLKSDATHHYFKCGESCFVVSIW